LHKVNAPDLGNIWFESRPVTLLLFFLGRYITHLRLSWAIINSQESFRLYHWLTWHHKIEEYVSSSSQGLVAS
jgi:hypothetical protein